MRRTGPESGGARFRRSGGAPFSWRIVVAGAGLMVLLAACGGEAAEGGDVLDGEALGSLPVATTPASPTPADPSVEPAPTPDEAAEGTTAAPSTTATTAPSTIAPPPASTAPPSTPTTVPPPVSERRPRTAADASEEDPVPVGEVLEFTGVWDIVVTEVDLDAADVVLAYADINPQPAEGYRYVLIGVEGTYLGERVAQPVFEWAVSDGVTEFAPSIPGCGVVPDSIYDVVEVAPGESFRAQLCVPVPSAAVSAGLELFLQPVGDEPRFFDLS